MPQDDGEEFARHIKEEGVDAEDMEETVADVFVTLWKNTDNIVDGKLKGYICSIAKIYLN